MEIYPSKIKGSIKISGAKNASLPIIAASMVCSNKTKLTNVPNIKDIDSLLTILSKIGVGVKFKNNKLYLKQTARNCSLLFDEVKKFRASYYLMSVFLVLFNEVEIYYPGGCTIGSRPIDFHLDGFRLAGCEVYQNENLIKIKAKCLSPFTYKMAKKSMGATVNLMILASRIKGTTILKNASTEPEIDDLMKFLNKGNCVITRKNNDIVIKGNECIKDVIKHKIIPDRIEAFTYMCIGTQSKKLKIKNVNINHLKMPIFFLKSANSNIKVKRNSIVIRKSSLKNINANSGDYPSLSTDQMPLLYPLFTKVTGESKFHEGIFEGRFNVCEELKKTNANITIDKNCVIINGVKDTIGCELNASDLRGAASLLIEGIINQNSTICNLEYLERGYNNIYQNLKKIGLNFKIL